MSTDFINQLQRDPETPHGRQLEFEAPGPDPVGREQRDRCRQSGVHEEGPNLSRRIHRVHGGR
jgi:hypothetical protein